MDWPCSRDSHYICMVLGTGIGGGIIYQNELIKGAHGMAGEVAGWLLRKLMKALT